MTTQVFNADITVQFSNGTGDKRVLAQIDDRSAKDNGLNNGVTSFISGDNVFILLFKSEGVSVTDIINSDGNIVRAGSGQYITRERVKFTPGNLESSASKPINGNFTYTWLGSRNPGQLSAFNEDTIRLTPKANTPAIGIADVTYTSRYDAYRLNSTTAEEVLIVFIAEEV